MKVVILAGGLGTRFAEETHLKPKPMIEIGGMPILWHIMKCYSYYGLNDFVICCGYKGYKIKEYFSNYWRHMSDVTYNLNDNTIEIHKEYSEPWKVSVIDTGEETMTGGRLKRVSSYLDSDESFCFTYGDGLCNVNIKNLIDFHNNHGLKATLTAVNPPGRFGALDIDTKGIVKTFKEKPRGDGAKINGGYFVLNKDVIDLLTDDSCIFEKEPLEGLANNGQLKAFEHDGFWQPMDTLRDKLYLEDLWKADAPWRVWQ